jgi:hypothetical protein
LSVGGYALLDMSAEWMTQNADLVSNHPDITGWLVWGLDLVRDVGVVVVLGVWAFISIAIILVACLIQRGRKLLKINQ